MTVSARFLRPYVWVAWNRSGCHPPRVEGSGKSNYENGKRRPFGELLPVAVNFFARLAKVGTALLPVEVVYLAGFILDIVHGGGWQTRRRSASYSSALSSHSHRIMLPPNVEFGPEVFFASTTTTTVYRTSANRATIDCQHLRDKLFGLIRTSLESMAGPSSKKSRVGTDSYLFCFSMGNCWAGT